MSFRLRIRYYLVHNFGFTNKQATEIILSKTLSINNTIVDSNIFYNQIDGIFLNGNILKPQLNYTYIAFYKPRGIETTHNFSIKNNLTTVLNFDKPLGFAGRLDKDSEGLLLLTDNGKLIQKLSHPNSEKEKEYLVTVHKNITNHFITTLSKGVDIVIAKTKPCVVHQLNEREFKIILKEGKNRQIRRMCSALGYDVIKLIRTRIDTVLLENLKPGEFRILGDF